MKDKNHWENYLKRKIKRIQEDKGLLENNKQIIINFLDNKRSEGIGYRRVIRISELLANFAKDIERDLDKITEEALRKYIEKLESSKLAEWTKYTYKVVIRDFYRYQNEGELPKFCRFMNMSTRKMARKLPDDIWSEEEINKLINEANDIIWKAFISLGFESGVRLGELLNMKIKDIHFNDFGARIRLDGKTGVREIPIIKCIPHLSTYLKIHPERENQDAWLWVYKNKKRVSDVCIRVNLFRLAKKIGTTKKSNPHLVFRHSRATQLANHLTESQLKQYFGWTQDTKMALTYIHLSGKDIDNAVLGMYGMAKKKEEEIQNGLPIKCFRCSFPNEPTAKFYGNCGLPLDTKTAIEEEGKINKLSSIGNQLLEKKDFQEALAEALKKLIEEKPELLQGLNFNTSQTSSEKRNKHLNF